MSEMVVFMVAGKIIRHQQKTLDYLDEEFHNDPHASSSAATIKKNR
jgi:hypothetical protein